MSSGAKILIPVQPVQPPPIHRLRPPSQMVQIRALLFAATASVLPLSCVVHSPLDDLMTDASLLLAIRSIGGTNG